MAKDLVLQQEKATPVVCISSVALCAFGFLRLIDMEECPPTAFERLLSCQHVYSHILRDILSCLDPASLRSLRCASRGCRDLVDKVVWGNKVARGRMRRRLRNKYSSFKRMLSI